MDSKTNENETDILPDYIKAIFDAVEKANEEMHKYGATLHWRLKIAPYHPVITRRFE
jgi:hypothetical protein